jgi:hypothetical protein
MILLLISVHFVAIDNLVRLHVHSELGVSHVPYKFEHGMDPGDVFELVPVLPASPPNTSTPLPHNY